MTIEYPKLQTHKNYIWFIRKKSEWLSVEFWKKIQNLSNDTLSKKINLIKFTFDLLKQEYEKILSFPEYSIAASSWISVKAYYILFNLFLIIDFFISADSRSFFKSHLSISKDIKQYLDTWFLKFSDDYFNYVFSCERIYSLWKSIAWLNIQYNPSEVELYELIMKKILKYKLEDFEIFSKIENYRTRKNREKKKNFLKNNKIMILDLFYSYRIKSNYRDLDFLNDTANVENFKIYYIYYYKSILNIYTAIKEKINKELNAEILLNVL